MWHDTKLIVHCEKKKKKNMCTEVIVSTEADTANY